MYGKFAHDQDGRRLRRLSTCAAAQTLLKTMTSDLGKSLKQRQQNVQNTQATLNALSNNLSVEPAKHVSNVAAERATPGTLSGIICCHLA